jgi:hypothetical protein
MIRRFTTKSEGGRFARHDNKKPRSNRTLAGIKQRLLSEEISSLEQRLETPKLLKQVMMRELKGIALDRFLMRKQGRHWDSALL